MTNQEAFDKVWQFFIVEKNPQSFENSADNLVFGAACAYRGQNGSKCAVGCLIPDELYSPDMEDKRIFAIIELYPEIKTLFADVDGFFLAKIQEIHDHHFPYFQINMENLAIIYDLKIPEGTP